VCVYTQTHTHTLTHKHTYGTCGSLWHVKCIVCVRVCVCVCVCVCKCVEKAPRMPYLYRSFPANETYKQWLVCGRTHAHTEDRPFFHTHCNTLQHTATHCNTLQHTATPCVEDKHTPNRRHSMGQHTATYCNILQHSATLCNTLQHPWQKDTHTHGTEGILWAFAALQNQTTHTRRHMRKKTANRDLQISAKETYIFMSMLMWACG